MRFNLFTWGRGLGRQVCALASLFVLLAPVDIAAAEPPARLLRVGILMQAEDIDGTTDVLRRHLAVLGFVEGRDYVVDFRNGGFDPTNLAKAAADLVKLKVDVILAYANPAAFAARQATRTIPIVAWAAHGAVETGLVSNLRRPGGNITGTESLAPELDAKRTQFLKQIVPGAQLLGVLYDTRDQGSPQHLRLIAAAGQTLGISHALLPVATPADITPAMNGYKGPPLGALITLTSWMIGDQWPRIQELAARRNLPTLCEFRWMAEKGCLLSYGPIEDELSERCAAQIAKILRGTPPGDLPVEQPTRFELVINLRTAKALGLTVPQELLLRADGVIE
jgi:putative ABC transport system substrate-binding protein